MIKYDDEERARKLALAEKEMEQYYRNVFGSAEGRKVLGHILMANHFGVPLNTEVERIEYNVGVAIARMSGMMGEIDRLIGIGGELK